MATRKRKGEYASGLEERVAKELDALGVKYEYESVKFIWKDYNPRAVCEVCGAKEVYQQRSYTPDFILAGGLIIEVKGRLTRRDRRVLCGVRKSNPDIDLRIIFDKDNRINKGAKSRYSDWAASHDFLYSLKGKVPEIWTKTQKEK